MLAALLRGVLCPLLQRVDVCSRDPAPCATADDVHGRLIWVVGKYDPLRTYLEQAGDRAVTMTFSEVVALVGGLPESAYRHRSWWSNSPWTTAPRHAWLAAGRRVRHVDMAAKRVTFGPLGGTGPAQQASRTAPMARVKTRAAPPLPAPVALSPEQVRSLEAFLSFRGESRGLRYRIAEIEQTVQGLPASEAFAAAQLLGVNEQMLEGTRLAKELAAQVDVVLHAAGILHALPYVLALGEVVELVSLGAGNTGRQHDLQTDRQVAEFKFIGWVGGPETVRQDHLLIDLFHLATAATMKRRVMYLTGSDIPLQWLRTSHRVTRECLARKRRLPARFDEQYGPDAFHHVCDYWAAIEATVEVVDLAERVPGLAPIAILADDTA